MKKLLSRIFLTEFLCIWVFWLLLAGATISLQYFSAAAELRITAKANRIGITQVYWRNTAHAYKEKLSSKRLVNKDYQELKFQLNYINSIDYIRIDPLKDKGTLEIISATLFQPFHEPVDLLPVLLSQNLVPIQQGTVNMADEKIFLKSSGQDPAFEFPVRLNALSASSISVILLSCLACAATTSLLLNQRFIKGDKLSGTLCITLQKDKRLSLPTLLSSSRGYVSATPNLENQRRYTFPIKQLNSKNLVQLLSDIRSSNPEATTVFHYNRTGEV